MKKIVCIFCCIVPIAGFAMADRTAPVYGRPTLYGEYEISAADARVAAKLYGATPRNSGVKMPVKTKTAIPKKSVKKKKAPKKTSVKEKPKAEAPRAATPDVIVVPPRDGAQSAPKTDVVAPAVPDKAPSVPVPAAPSKDALAIAASARAVRHENSYCTQRGKRSTGRIPDGFVLMPGRPDLMSCSDK